MSLRRIRGALRSLAGDRRGVSVVEFALIAPFLGVLVMGIGDLARGFSAKFALEQAAHRALERVISGTTASPAATQNYDYVKAEAAAAAGVPLANVTLQQWLECEGVRQASFTTICGANDEIERYISIRIDSEFEPSFPYGPLGEVAEDGTVPIFAEAALRVQ